MSDAERKMMDCTEICLDLGKLTEEQRVELARAIAKRSQGLKRSGRAQRRSLLTHGEWPRRTA